MDALEKKTRDLLNSVYSAGAVLVFLSLKAAASSVKAGMLIQNSTLVDEAGALATKITPYGIAYLQSPEGTDPATIEGDKTVPAPDGPGTGFSNADGDDGDNDGNDDATKLPATLTASNGVFPRSAMVMPEENNGRKSGYPTDALVAPITLADGTVVNDGYWLGPTNEVTKPSDVYPAIANAANKRWSKKSPQRKFTSRSMDGGLFDKKNAGVMGVAIFRTL